MKATTADRLRQIMNERGLKQRDILELCQPYCDRYKIKFPKSALSQYISGKVLPASFKLTILGEALGVSEAWLMGYDVPRERAYVREKFDPTHTSAEKDLLTLFRLVPEDKRGLVLEMIRAALKSQG